MIEVSAIVLAAGLSSRMGQSKTLLPWGGTTILGRIVGALAEAGLDEIIVVTGAGHELVENEVAFLARVFPVRAEFNKNYETGEMLSSIQTGLRTASSTATAGLVTLGDQPQILVETVQLLLAARKNTKQPLIMPSFKGRRGHPWLIGRQLWSEFLEMRLPSTARDFFEHYSSLIQYVEIQNPSILKDVDTPSDYAQEKPV